MTELEHKIKLLAKRAVDTNLLHEELEAIVEASKAGALRITDHAYSCTKGSWETEDTYHVVLVMDITVPRK